MSKNSAWPTILKSVRNSQKVRFRFQWYVIPILIPIPGFPKYFDSDSDSDSSGLWFWFRFRFRGFPNIMIPTPIPIPVVHDSDSDSDSRVSQISWFWFRFRFQCHIVLIPIPIPTYQALIPIPIPESDSDSGIIYNSGLFYSHNGINSITIIGLLTLWGQDLEFYNHTQSIVNEFPISFFKGNFNFGLEVAAGTRARPADIVWDQVHKKIKEGKSWPTRNPTFHRYLLKSRPDQIILHRL